VSPQRPGSLSDATAGQPPADAFTVAVSIQDANGNTVTGYTGLVSVAPGRAGPVGAGLAGATTVQAANGVATFNCR